MIDIETMNHETYMKEALKEARTALERGDRPVGCVIVHNGEIVARGSNHEFTIRSKFEHAETRTVRSCAQYLYANSNECVLYTTVEPCVMCLGTIVMANIRHVIYGAPDPDCGGTDMYRNVGYVRRSLRGCYIGGVLAAESQQLRDAFQKCRQTAKD